MSRDRFRVGELGLDQLGRAQGFYQAPPADDSEAARVLAEADAERRESVAQQRALESLAGLTNEEGSPMVQPERGLQRQLGVRSVDDIALEEFARSPGVAAALNMGEALPLPLSRLGIGALDSENDYEGTQRELDRLLAEGRAENPVSSMAGMGAGILPAVAAAPVIAASSPILAPLGPSGARVAAGTLEGMLTANAQDAAARRPLAESSVPTAALFGMGLGSAAEGAGQFVDMARRAVPSLESFADLMRVRGSAGRTLPQVRAINELPGGIPAAARDLRELGISPRGSVHSMDTAAERAAGVNARASRDLGRVFDEMRVADEAADAIANSPRNAALEAIAEDDPGLLYPSARGSAEDRIRREILTGRVDRSAAETRAQRRANVLRADDVARADTMAADALPPPAPTSTGAATPRARQLDPNRQRPQGLPDPRDPMRRPPPTTPEVLQAIDRGQITAVAGLPGIRGTTVRPTLPPQTPEGRDQLMALVDELLPQRRTGTVALDEVLGALGESARRYEGVPSAGPLRAGVQRMAGDFEGANGRLTFDRAQTEKRVLDRSINYNPSANPVNPRSDMAEDDIRAARRALQREMDAAVQRHDPELGELYPRARRTHQLSGIVGRVGEDAALRDTANRQVSKTDYDVAVQADSLMGMARNAIMNRVFRGREATIGAVGAERLSDALQAMPSVRGGGQRVARTAAATAAPRPTAVHAAPAATQAPAGFDQAEFDALPVMDAAGIQEFSDDELGSLPELSDDEINALPVMDASEIGGRR